MHEQQVQRYEQELYQTANLARISQVAEALTLRVAIEAAVRQEMPPATEDGFDPKKLPVREMKKRGWLSKVEVEGVADAPDYEIAANFILQSTGGQALASLHKQNLKLGAKANPYALLAWKARVLEKARVVRQQLGPPRPLDPIFIKNLVGLSKHPGGIVEAVKLLRSIGVIVVFEEHLSTTYLDGAALLLDNQVPVVAMTLRHDRLDNFWFVLLHEIGHIARHRDSGLQDGFFDDDSVSSVAQLEAEADEFARGALIPDALWKSSFVKFSKSKKEVVDFASRIGVGVPIVAGRIRGERGEYSLFSDLVGSGEVRKRIADANLMGG
jgi:HTH-type transcriptional regulator/antitoxin HigA